MMRRMRADKKLHRIRVIYDMTGKPGKKNLEVKQNHAREGGSRERRLARVRRRLTNHRGYRMMTLFSEEKESARRYMKPNNCPLEEKDDEQEEATKDTKKIEKRLERLEMASTMQED